MKTLIGYKTLLKTVVDGKTDIILLDEYLSNMISGQVTKDDLLAFFDSFRLDDFLQREPTRREYLVFYLHIQHGHNLVWIMNFFEERTKQPDAFANIDSPFLEMSLGGSMPNILQKLFELWKSESVP